MAIVFTKFKGVFISLFAIHAMCVRADVQLCLCVVWYEVVRGTSPRANGFSWSVGPTALNKEYKSPWKAMRMQVCVLSGYATHVYTNIY